MTTIKLFSLIAFCTLITAGAAAQKQKTESFKISGECGMCKKKIEKAAKQAGAADADWSTTTKLIKVSYDPATTTVAAIQQAIANSGYDTPQYKATDEAYNALHDCCKYERQPANAKVTATCEKKDGKCADPAACKEKGCSGATEAACCKKS